MNSVEKNGTRWGHRTLAQSLLPKSWTNLFWKRSESEQGCHHSFVYSTICQQCIKFGGLKTHNSSLRWSSLLSSGQTKPENNKVAIIIILCIGYKDKVLKNTWTGNLVCTSWEMREGFIEKVIAELNLKILKTEVRKELGGKAPEV